MQIKRRLKMWPIIFNFVRIYAPYIVMPVAVVVGSIGYAVEQTLFNKQPISAQNSIDEDRDNRLLHEFVENNNPVEVSKLKDRKFVPKTVFDRQT